jgi:hypothetical protein
MYKPYVFAVFMDRVVLCVPLRRDTLALMGALILSSMRLCETSKEPEIAAFAVRNSTTSA